MTRSPGYARQGTARTVFRILGIVLTVVGLLLVVSGFVRFVGGEPGDDLDSAFLAFAGGGVLAVVGFAFFNLGFMGASARYAAGETMPVVKDSASYLTDGEGVLGVGRTIDDAGATTAPKAGPYCRACGQRNDDEARFCDACGQPLA